MKKVWKEGDELVCIKDWHDEFKKGECGIVKRVVSGVPSLNGELVWHRNDHDYEYFIYSISPGLQDLSDHFDYTPEYKFRLKFEKLIEE